MKLVLTILFTVLGLTFMAGVIAVLWAWSVLAWLKFTLHRQLARGGAH